MGCYEYSSLAIPRRHGPSQRLRWCRLPTGCGVATGLAHSCREDKGKGKTEEGIIVLDTIRTNFFTRHSAATNDLDLNAPL
jgi:hypothetical protein